MGKPKVPNFNILIVAQGGRLKFEALLFAASLARVSPELAKRLYVAEPLPGPKWSDDPRVKDPAARAFLEATGAQFLPFENRHFGASYPYGNKIEALAALPAGEPFVFFDTDTLITAPLETVDFDFARPSASVRVEPSWPEPQPYIATYDAIWRALYQRFDLDFEASLDLSQPLDHWQRYLYFNAGWFFGQDPQEFGRRFLEIALAIRNDPGEILAAQSLDPWLDQVALPLVISSFGGGAAGKRPRRPRRRCQLPLPQPAPALRPRKRSGHRLPRRGRARQGLAAPLARLGTGTRDGLSKPRSQKGATAL